MTRILVVDDEAAMRLALGALLRKEGYDVTLASGGKEALAALEGEPFDLVLTDLALGRGASGMDVLTASRRVRPETPVVVVTAHGSEKVAVEAMKAGAGHYVPKPFDNDEIRLVVSRELERTKLAREHRLLLERVAREHGAGAMIGTGRSMRAVFDMIAKVAETDLGVLVHGESGVGKELDAQAIHEASGRRSRALVAVNCAALSKELVESELFGHEKGAFTGADARRIGRFEAASDGTIFLDEIGDMPLETQAKVLRVLESRTFERVGGNAALRTEARVIAATHRDLAREVTAGRFREDLLYRIKVVQITVPPLRERPEDIPALAFRFAQRFAERLGRPTRTFTDGAMRALAAHSWPGNVRELRSVVEQAAVFAVGDAVAEEDLRLHAPAVTPDAHLPFTEARQQAIETFERGWLTQALAAHDGNVSRTAAAIGIARQSLQQKLRGLGLRGAKDEGD